MGSQWWNCQMKTIVINHLRKKSGNELLNLVSDSGRSPIDVSGEWFYLCFSACLMGGAWPDATFSCHIKNFCSKCCFCVTYFKDLMSSTQRSRLAWYRFTSGEISLSWGVLKCFTFAGRNSCTQIISFTFQSFCQTSDLFGLRGNKNPEEF